MTFDSCQLWPCLSVRVICQVSTTPRWMALLSHSSLGTRQPWSQWRLDLQQNLATFKQNQKGSIFKNPGSYLSRVVAPLWRIRPSRNTGLYIGLQQVSVTIINTITKTISEEKGSFPPTFCHLLKSKATAQTWRQELEQRPQMKAALSGLLPLALYLPSRRDRLPRNHITHRNEKRAS